MEQEESDVKRALAAICALDGALSMYFTARDRVERAYALERLLRDADLAHVEREAGDAFREYARRVQEGRQ